MEEIFIKSFYNTPQSKGNNIGEQIGYKELLVEEVKLFDDINFDTMKKFGFYPEQEIEKSKCGGYEDISRDILIHINKYFICLENRFESLLSLRKKEFDCLITWTNKINKNNKTIYSLESTNWCVCKDHKLGVRVDYRFQNIINSIFLENKHRNCFLSIDSKIYFDYSDYIIINQGEKALKQLKEKLNSEYIIF